MQMIPMLTLAFSVLLVLGVLISERASRTVLSTAVLFLLGGFVLGQGMLDIVPIQPGDPVVGVLAQLALFSVLFTDGMKVGLSDLRRAWRLKLGTRGKKPSPSRPFDPKDPSAPCNSIRSVRSPGSGEIHHRPGHCRPHSHRFLF
jgi:hypothetical protein